MATKTFEELKQLAIQIRDEKTNKANTATRIGTQMIEHLNKLEQEYYTIQTVDGLVSEYNVSVNHPTSGIDGSNKYTLSSAIALVPEQYRSIGIKCSFIGENGQGETWEYKEGSWNVANFIPIGGIKISELDADINSTKALVIYKTHIDNLKGNKSYVIPFNLKGQGENLTLRVKNTLVEYNGQEPRQFAVSFMKKDGDYTAHTLYDNGEKTLVNIDEIESIRVNTNIGIESLSLDIEVENGDVLSDIKKNKEDIESLKTSVSNIEEASINKLIYPETFNLTSPNSYKIDKKFKAGDVISLICKNFNFEATSESIGQYNIVISDSNKTNIYVNNRPSKGNILDNVIIHSDTDYITVSFSYDDTVTSMSADFTISIDSTKSLISGEKVDSIGAFKYIKHISLGGINKITIPFNYEAGQPITLKVSNYSVQSEGGLHNINLNYNKKTLAVLYGNGEKNVILENRSDSLILQIGVSGNVTSLEADVEILYGGFSSIYSEQTDLQNQINDNDNKINTINSVVGITPESIEIKGTTDDWVYSASRYIGLDVPFKTDCLLKTLSINCFEATSESIGELFEFVVGTIDQRDWLLPRITFTKSVSDIKSGVLYFNFEDDKIIAKEGEVIFIKMHNLADRAVLCGLSNSTYDAGKIVKYTDNLSVALSSYSDKGFSNFSMEVINVDSIFSYKEDMANIENSVSNIQSQITNSKTYVDDITNERYLLKVSNGELILQSLKIKNMLIIGHSFVVYGNAPQADWNLDDGENRAMAPSINAHQWTEFIKSKLKCTVELKSGVDFERNYSPDYDFASKWNVQDNHDVICIYLNENAVYNDTMQASWEAMLNYLKSAAPRARIFCTGSWTSNDKEKAIKAACSNVYGINYVDCIGLYSTKINASTIWKRGDYYYGRESQYYPMGAPNSHPNDVGHLDIANRFLQSFGEDTVKGNTHNITLNQKSGGTIETPNAVWVENGIVTIRCNPSDGYSISNVSVQREGGGSVEVTRRTNTMYDDIERVYYTFTMPNENVLITPTWLVE